MNAPSLPTVSRKLSLLLPLFGSANDHEALAAVRAAGRALTSAGCDWYTIAALLPEPAVCTDPEAADALAYLADRPLDRWGACLLRAILGQLPDRPLSALQRHRLLKLAGEHGWRRAAA